MTKNKWFLVITLGLLLMLLTSCSGPDEHLWLKSPGWSRAVFLGGTAIGEPVPIALDENDNLYFVLIDRDAEAETAHFRIMSFTPDADIRWEQVLTNVSMKRPLSSQLLWIDDGLRLFWIDQEQLHMLDLDANGNPVQAPVVLSGEHMVDSYSVVTDSVGSPVLWYAGSREEPGVYGIASFDGSSPSVVLDANGINIQLRYDQDGVLHASWLHYPIGYGRSEILYTAYAPGETWQLDQYAVVQEFSVSPTSSFSGPVLGLDDESVYIFGTIMFRSGFQAGTIQTEYVHFPFGQPENVSIPLRIPMPSIYTLDHVYLPNTTLDAGERVVVPDPNSSMTTSLQDITTNINAEDELAIAFRTPTQHMWRKERYQVNVAYFQNGSPFSYQPLSYTSTFSTLPNIVSADNYLYVTWLEKHESDSYTVYFASTTQVLKDALNRSTGREYWRVVAQVSFGMLVGILLAPIAASLWTLAPFAVLFVTSPLRKLGSKPVQNAFTVLSMLVAIAAYWAGKLATLPGMLDYVPFSAWLPEIPAVAGVILRWFVPLLISAIALGLAWYYTYQRSNQSTLFFLLIYIGVDALFTAAIYAVLFYGAL